jgi:hypothetical protein
VDLHRRRTFGVDVNGQVIVSAEEYDKHNTDFGSERSRPFVYIAAQWFGLHGHIL